MLLYYPYEPRRSAHYTQSSVLIKILARSALNNSTAVCVWQFSTERKSGPEEPQRRVNILKQHITDSIFTLSEKVLLREV